MKSSPLQGKDLKPSAGVELTGGLLIKKVRGMRNDEQPQELGPMDLKGQKVTTKEEAEKVYLEAVLERSWGRTAPHIILTHSLDLGGSGAFAKFTTKSRTAGQQSEITQQYLY